MAVGANMLNCADSCIDEACAHHLSEALKVNTTLEFIDLSRKQHTVLSPTASMQRKCDKQRTRSATKEQEH